MNAESAELVKTVLGQNAYERFLAEGARGLTPEEVHAVLQARGWGAVDTADPSVRIPEGSFLEDFATGVASDVRSVGRGTERLFVLAGLLLAVWLVKELKA